MMNLYSLTGKFLEILELSEIEDVSELLEQIDVAIEEKADGMAKIIKQLTGDIETIKAEEKRLAEKRRVIENNIVNMKENLQLSMELTGKEKFKTELFSFGIQNNPVKVVWENEDIESIPSEYKIVKEEINKEKVKEDLKDGLCLEFAKLVQTRSIRIR